MAKLPATNGRRTMMEWHMSKMARCKFTVEGVSGDPASGLEVTMHTQYDAELSEEDRAFSQATPWGEMKFEISNPALAGFFQPGKSYYVDITPAEG